MNIQYYTDRFLRDIVSFANTMDSTQWAVLSVVTCVAGYMLLKGNNIKGG